jgi:hypothetical protein
MKTNQSNQWTVVRSHTTGNRTDGSFRQWWKAVPWQDNPRAEWHGTREEAEARASTPSGD